MTISHSMEEDFGQYFDSVIPFEVKTKILILISAVIGTHFENFERVVMEVLNDVIKDDLE